MSGNDALDRHQGAIRALSAVIDGWRREFSDVTQPDEKVEAALEQLTSTVEQWRFEFQKSTVDLESRMAREINGLGSKLGNLQASDKAGQDAFKHALVSIWNKLQDLEAGTRASAEQGHKLADTEAQVLHGLRAIHDQVVATQSRSLERQEVIASHLTSLVEALKTAVGHSDEVTHQIETRIFEGLEALDARMTERLEASKVATDQLEQSIRGGLSSVESLATEAISQAQSLEEMRYQELREVLGASLASLEAATAVSISELHADQLSRTEELITALDARLGSLEAAIAGGHEGQNARTEELVKALKTRFMALEAATAGAISEGHAAQNARLGSLEAAIAEGHAAQSVRTEELVKALDARLGSLEAAIAGIITEGHATQNARFGPLEAAIAEGHAAQNARTEELVKALKTRFSALEAATGSATQVAAQTLKMLEAVDVRIGDLQLEAKAASKEGYEKARRSLDSGLSETNSQIHSLRSEFAEMLERSHQTIVNRTEVIESRVDDTLSVSAEAIQQLKSSVSTLADSIKHIRSDVREAAEQTEMRMSHQIEMVENRSLQAMADLRLAFSEERRASKVEMQNRIDVGVTQPLKNVVALVNQQLNDIQATVERTLDTLRNGGMMMGLDNPESRPYRLKAHKLADILDLPSVGKSE